MALYIVYTIFVIVLQGDIYILHLFTERVTNVVFWSVYGGVKG